MSVISFKINPSPRLYIWLRNDPFFSYPLYRRGNPQLRIYLPNFWMKLLNPEKQFVRAPPNRVTFEVSPEMTKLDVKNYLEKIYKVNTHFSVL